jgi:hypothetical protein
MIHSTERHTYKNLALFLIIISGVVVAVVLLAAPRPAKSQTTGVPITGYAWSDTIGWIDLNCANLGVCSSNPFGLSIDSNGQISGSAWSDNVGWISANASDLSGCPQSPCTANIQGNALVGWLKALSADNNGWDGFISLSGSNYGPILSSGTFSGQAWGGGTDIGWIDFSQATTTWGTCTPSYSCSGNSIIYTAASCDQSTIASCVSPAFCSAGSSSCLYPTPTPVANGNFTGNLQVVPNLVSSGEITHVYWDISNVQSCSVTGTNGNSWTGLTSGPYGATTTAILQQTLYTLSCLTGASSTFMQTAEVNIVPAFKEK